jgi:NodT family efflux transporter outer membrane factor (OMF) lipoprotein
MKRASIIAASLLASASLAACKVVGPNYQAPQVSAPAHFAETAQGATAETADLTRWWTQLGDPMLDSLITRALTQNLDLKTAQSRLREARDQITIARSALLPSVSGSAVAARRDVPFASNAPAGGSASSGGSPLAALPAHLNLYSLGVDATWELDLFGGVRRGVEAANAQAEAAEWQGRDVQVALSAEVARSYLTLRLAQAQKAADQADVARLNDLMDLVAARARAGVTTDLDVNQQRQALQAKLAEMPQLDMQARQAIHALATLLALPPASLDAELAPVRDLPAAPVTLPLGLPSDLLKRRPDIRAAERQLAAATAAIGVAEADLYPKLNLIGLASFAGTDLGSLLSKRNFSTIGLGNGSVPIFNSGRGRAQVAAKREAANQAETAYEAAILTALKEVEDALVSYNAASEQERLLTDDLRTAQDSEALAGRRYDAGLTDFTSVLQIRAAIDAAETQRLSARSARIGALVALFTALGGGWSES